jgi:hypothetical protein
MPFFIGYMRQNTEGVAIRKSKWGISNFCKMRFKKGQFCSEKRRKPIFYGNKHAFTL